ncbi:DUF1015 domain-containing protein [Coriobacteriia bacterium Es71-Z0120]|uniref:DUF1015 domain-containing protein n=1 Tax=Parvivirga hydrogeniphila TaxID=2939460 RepID=UPI002260F803|nr:DUF1015 domain-containing protein [Parvivirga hydrogeniphila]MCL4079228.1 DUF1015 domain-containing protein [Parvivirga hydrogeniphila]
MPLVRPFRAITYNRDLGPDISRLIAPPYDVVDAAMRAELLSRDPRNIVAIDLPEGSDDPDAPDYRYRAAHDLWRRWQEDGVLTPDESPALYLLEQDWEHEGRPVRRRALLAAVRIHSFEEGVIVPHERTLPKAIADRLELTRACAANLSPVFGLYSDPAGEAEAVLDAAGTGAPLFEAVGDDAARSRLWTVRDHRAIAALAQVLADKQVFIADGHHRYTVAVAYRDERRAQDAAAGVERRDPAYDYVLMALVNMDDPELLVLATHRVARARGAFDPDAFFDALAERFVLEPASASDIAKLDAIERPAFLVATKSGDLRLAVLRDDVDLDEAIPLPASHHWKSLDVAVLQELVLRPVLGIHPDEPETLERLSFVKDTRAALEVPGGDVAFVLRPTRMEQLKAVALAGEKMPQKSTYFHPKLPTGLVFHALD